jgi:hypothetical protein
MSARHYIAGILTGLVLYYPACGGGGDGSSSSTPPPTPPVATPAADTADHYLTQFFPRARTASSWGYPIPATVFSQWTSGRDGTNSARRASSQSRHTCNGADYATSDGYGDDHGTFYAIEAVINRITQNGVTVDLAQHCPSMPPIMLPWALPASGEIVEEQYFWIHDAAGNRNRPGYWRGVWTIGLSAFNPCWQGSGSNLPRPSPHSARCWWDSFGRLGTVTPRAAGALPWQGGVPVDIETVSDVYDSYGRDAGPLWRGQDAASSCV